MKATSLFVCFKSFILGFLSVTFWWTIWTGADEFQLGDTSTYGLLYYAGSYACMVTAYLWYLLMKQIFRNKFEKTANSNKCVSPLPVENVAKLPIKKFLLNKMVLGFFAFSVYILGFQYVLLWRNIFGTFYYVMDELGYKGIPHWATLLMYIITTGATMLFTSGKGIVLFPTLQKYRNDTLTELKNIFEVNQVNKTWRAFLSRQKQLWKQGTIGHTRKYTDPEKLSNVENEKAEMQKMQKITCRNEKDIVLKNNNVVDGSQIFIVEDFASTPNEIVKVNNENNNKEKVVVMDKDVEQTVERDKNKEKSSIGLNVVSLYLFRVHYNHIFLNVMGGIYWCAIWRYYDYLLEEMKLETNMMGIIKLLPIAISAHVINHIFLMPQKLKFKNKFIKLAFNAVLGAFTTIIWASIWYVLDRFSWELDTWTWPVKISLHYGSFGLLFIVGHCSVIV